MVTWFDRLKMVAFVGSVLALVALVGTPKAVNPMDLDLLWWLKGDTLGNPWDVPDTLYIGSGQGTGTHGEGNQHRGCDGAAEDWNMVLRWHRLIEFEGFNW